MDRPGTTSTGRTLRVRPKLQRLGAVLALGMLATVIAPLTGTAQAAEAVTQTYSYTGSTQTFTVPEGVTSIQVELRGGQGGRGGHDSQGTPWTGGYRGLVSGTIDVEAGDVFTVAVGGGGGIGQSSRGSAAGGTAGQNPLPGYDGAVGGIAGPLGSSGGGGGSGAATVLRRAGVDVVAGGGGGNGGNGQFVAIVGRRAEDHHVARPDTQSTTGRPGLNTIDVCSPEHRCDGGASGAGGGGADGGDRGNVQYGGGSDTEYFGFGGYPGSNDVAGLGGLSESYEFYDANSGNGSIAITYEVGTPGPPGEPSATPGPGRVDLTWSAPSNPGASATTDYVVQHATSASGPWTTFEEGTSTGTSATVTGLSNGTTYWFRVAAVNEYGTGSWSPATALGTVPSDVPGAPTIDDVVAFDSGLYLDFTPGESDAPILSYQMRLDSGDWQTATHAAGRVTVSGLTNGRTYSVRLRAVNAVGVGAASSQAEGTPVAVASAPQALLALAGDGTVDLTWDSPAADNGSPITDYVVHLSTDAAGPFVPVEDGVSAATAARIEGLDNGTTYHFRVAAVNGAGTGAESKVAAATPFTIPGAPVIDSVTPKAGALQVTVSTPDDGGSSIVLYEHRIDGGPWRSNGSAATTFTVGGLTNGTSYAVEVRAVNAAGVGPASEPSSGTPRTVPAAPAISAVALDTGAVGVSFTLGSDGGSPITDVEYSVDGGDSWVTRSPASLTSPLTISGLTGGETYEVMLRAVNAAGAGLASSPSSVTVKGAPAAPTVTGVTAGDRSLTVAFSTPSNGGTPITNYEVSVDGGDTWTPRSPASTSSPVVVTGLENGTSYQVRIRAVNAVGSGAPSAASTATPRTVPGAPAISGDTIVGVDGVLDVEFSAPASNGGSAITTYQYSTDGGATWRERSTGTTGSPLRISTESADGTTPLTGGEVYPVEIRAVNAAGPGAASAIAEGMTTTAPAAPVIDDVDVRDSSAAVTFTPPANGGSAITAYEYSLDGGEWIDTGSLSGELVIDGLDNATTYSLRLRAVNGVGAGPASAAHSISVRTTPGAPAIAEVEPGPGTLTIEFDAPDSDGGSEVETYEYSTDGGLTWRERSEGTTGSPLVITATSGGDPLEDGTLYSIQLRAVNDAGSGDASSTALAAPVGPPAAPTSLALTPGDSQLEVSFDLGSDGGSAVTAVQYSLNGGGWVDAGTLASPFTITGLTNGTTYSVSVRVVSAVGAGPSSAAEGTPRTAPGAPRSVSATVGDQSTTVSWVAPGTNGGSAVTSSTVTLFDKPSGGIPVASCTAVGSTSCSVGDLDNGTTYYVAVVATNAAGNGPASSPRVAVTPLSTPDVSIAGITATSTSLTVDVDVADDGGSPITTFEYRLDGGEWTSAATSTEPFTILDLVTGHSYELEIRAVNGAGVGAPSAPVTAVPRTVPGAPSGLTATSGPASAVLSWSAPEDDGGSPVSDYRVQHATSAGGPWTTFSDGTSADTTATVTGLTNGTTYLFRVAAINEAGTGPDAGPSATTPLAAPSAPTINSITPGSKFLKVAFSGPGSNGGSAVTGYEYSLDGGEWKAASGTTSPLAINGLTNGHVYAVRIRAVNAVGGGEASSVVTATPYGLPSAVKGFTATPISGGVELNWDAADANGSPITNYNVIRWSAASEGTIAQSYSTTATSLDVTLPNGTYWFTIEATNAAGTGARSNPRTSVMVGGTAPAAPTFTSVGFQGRYGTVFWTQNSAGSQPITGYVAQYVTDDGEQTTIAQETSTFLQANIDVPSPAEPYTLRIALTSAAGRGEWATVRPPIITDESVTDVDARSARIDATASANGSDATVEVGYSWMGDDVFDWFGTTVDADPSTVSGTVATPVSAELDLMPALTYFARVRVTKGVATTVGEVQTFETDVALSTTGLERTYDGSPIEVVTETDPVGMPVTHTYEGIDGTHHPESTEAPTKPGRYRVTTTAGLGLGGSRTDTLVISPKELTVEVSAAAKPWDGHVGAELEFDLHGVVEGDDVSIDAEAVRGTFESASAGTGHKVTLDVIGSVLKGADAANYTVELPESVTADITRAGQRLAFSTPPPVTATVGSRLAPAVSSDAGLPVLLSIGGGSDDVCSVDGGEVLLTAVGTCVLVVSQPGNSDVQSADPLVALITVVAKENLTDGSGGSGGSGGGGTGAPGSDDGTDGGSSSDDAVVPIGAGGSTDGSRSGGGSSGAPSRRGQTHAGTAANPSGARATDAAEDEHPGDGSSGDDHQAAGEDDATGSGRGDGSRRGGSDGAVSRDEERADGASGDGSDTAFEAISSVVPEGAAAILGLLLVALAAWFLVGGRRRRRDDEPQQA